MQYKQEFNSTLIIRLNILHNLWLNQAADEKDLRQQKLLFFTKRANKYLKRKKLLMCRLRRRSRTRQQLAKNKLINTMRLTDLY